ncbi:hypothetical protein ACFMQL_06585 [Nonomuraea fastidiosa]|uniref:hypothetical protein n=1 Tax=Nonomuraea fastidiosa TaxID=46173 RepID=UPI003671D433
MRVLPAVLSAAAVFSLLPVPAAHAAAPIQYSCKIGGTTQEVGIDVELTVPAQAEVNEELTIGWTGSYAGDSELIAPATGLEGDIKMYAYAGISGIPNFTSATGVAEIGTVIPGEAIPLPTTRVELKTTPRNTGTGKVHAASINFGLTNTDPLIECEPSDTATRTEYTITVGTGQGSPTTSSSPTADDTESTTPTPDETDDTDETGDLDGTDEDAEETPAEVPSGGADTGGGGLAGPDGRALMGIGLVIFLASLTGLRLRRPRRT